MGFKDTWFNEYERHYNAREDSGSPKTDLELADEARIVVINQLQNSISTGVDELETEQEDEKKSRFFSKKLMLFQDIQRHLSKSATHMLEIISYENHYGDGDHALEFYDKIILERLDEIQDALKFEIDVIRSMLEIECNPVVEKKK